MTHADYDPDANPCLGDPTTQRLIADLQSACMATFPPERRVEIARVLSERALSGLSQPAVPRFRLRVRAWSGTRSSAGERRQGRRVALMGAAALLTLGGVLGYLRLQSPASVSAAQILQRAQAAMTQAQPGQVVHETSFFHATVQPQGVPHGPAAISYDQWTQLATGNGVARVDFRYKDSSGYGGLVADANGILWSYHSAGNTVVRSTWTPGTALFPNPHGDPIFLEKSTVLAPQDPGGIRELVQTAQGGSQAQVQLLPRQMLDGRPVDVVRLIVPLPADRPGGGATPAPNATEDIITVSVDASTYLIRLIDERAVNAQGGTVEEHSLQVTHYDVLPASSVPPGIFVFTPPPGAQGRPKVVLHGPGTLRWTPTPGGRGYRPPVHGSGSLHWVPAPGPKPHPATKLPAGSMHWKPASGSHS